MVKSYRVLKTFRGFHAERRHLFFFWSPCIWKDYWDEPTDYETGNIWYAKNPETVRKQIDRLFAREVI